jgi:hypothetical protein
VAKQRIRLDRNLVCELLLPSGTYIHTKLHVNSSDCIGSRGEPMNHTFWLICAGNLARPLPSCAFVMHWTFPILDYEAASRTLSLLMPSNPDSSWSGLIISIDELLMTGYGVVLISSQGSLPTGRTPGSHKIRPYLPLTSTNYIGT